jgi:hypothetical protein
LVELLFSSFPHCIRIISHDRDMSHSYTLKRCATFPTNVLGLISYVTLPWCEAGYQVSPSHVEPYLTLYSTLCIDPVIDRESYVIPAETLNFPPCSTRWGRYGLPPTIVPIRNTAQSSRLKIYGTKKKLLTCLSHSNIRGQHDLYSGWITDYFMLLSPKVTFPVQ